MKNLITGILLALLFICQSCTVYHKTPVPIQDAVDKGKVKLVETRVHEDKTSTETKVFRNITYEDEGYFGLSRINSNNSSTIKTQITVDESMSFHLKNKKSSRIITVIAIIPVGMVIVAGAVHLGLIPININ